GEVYVAGVTGSTDFPGTSGGAQSASGGGSLPADAFVARLNASLTALDQATYLGGSGDDGAAALALAPVTGEVYVAGFTGPPTCPGPKNVRGRSGGPRVRAGGEEDAFVAGLSAALRGTTTTTTSTTTSTTTTTLRPCTPRPASISFNFNGTSIAQGNYIWFN